MAASVAPAPPASPPPAVDRAALRAQLERDVRSFAIDRPPLSPGWRQVQRDLAVRLKQLGYATTRENFDDGGVNVIGLHPGARPDAELVVVSAHYDHLPFCAGADDNASGLAAVLAVATALAGSASDRALVIAFWDQEETGLGGSAEFAQGLKRRGAKVRAMLSLDGVGFASDAPGSQLAPEALGIVLPEMVKLLDENGRRGNFLGVMGDQDSERVIAAFERAGKQAALPIMGAALSKMSRAVLNDVARSDHASFWFAGYPGVLVTDTADFRNPHYHCGAGPDLPGTLDYDFLTRVAITTTLATWELLTSPESP